MVAFSLSYLWKWSILMWKTFWVHFYQAFSFWGKFAWSQPSSISKLYDHRECQRWLWNWNWWLTPVTMWPQWPMQWWLFLFFKDFTTSKHIAGVGLFLNISFIFFKILILNKGNIAGVGVSEQVESGDRWRVRFLPTAPTLVLVLTSPQLGLSTCFSNRGALDGGRYLQDTNTEKKQILM